MSKSINRRQFAKTTAAIGGLSFLPLGIPGCEKPPNYLYTPKGYDIFKKFPKPKKLVRFNTSLLSTIGDKKQIWLLQSILAIFQGLVNRTEPRIYLQGEPNDVDWLTIYKQQGFTFEYKDITDYNVLFKEYAPSFDGYIVYDPEMLDTLNIAQTLASLKNWVVISPDMEKSIQELGLTKKEDYRGRWSDRVDAYSWAFENLFPECSKHVVGDCCIDFPYHPSGASFHIRDFLVAHNAFTFDLSAARRQRREYKLLDKIYASMEFPAGVWGWHDSRDHEHWAVDRAARQGVYTICAVGGPNLTVHGGFKPADGRLPKQKASPAKNLKVEKNKIYIALMMTDGDALWVMNSLQLGNWGADKRGDFPLTWGFLPLLADIAPAMYLHFVEAMKDNDYMVAGPTGAGYTYPHMYPDQRQFLKYSKFYMQKCGLEIVNITNWDDYTNWQEVDLPEFNSLLFEEMDNCIGYVRGMGESAFGPNYNFSDKPYVFCGEGTHLNDKDDVATIKNFIDANPNRPLFVFCMNNISVSMERLKKVIDQTKDYDIEYVRLDDFMRLLKEAHKQGLITEDLYPNRQGNEQILIAEAPAQWLGTKSRIEKIIPVLNAQTPQKALELLNAEEAGLALGQEITEADKTDVLAFTLCDIMFALVKNALNAQGIYVNVRLESVKKFLELHGEWHGSASIWDLNNLWLEWEEINLSWDKIVQIGREFVQVYKLVDKNIFKQ
jgi:hypothetical protein